MNSTRGGFAYGLRQLTERAKAERQQNATGEVSPRTREAALQIVYDYAQHGLAVDGALCEALTAIIKPTGKTRRGTAPEHGASQFVAGQIEGIHLADYGEQIGAYVLARMVSAPARLIYRWRDDTAYQAEIDYWRKAASKPNHRYAKSIALFRAELAEEKRSKAEK